MILEHVHGLNATGMSLNERFTMFAVQPPAPVRARTPRRRPSVGGFYNQNMNRDLIEQIARRLQQQAKRQALRQRLGVGPGALRRFGSESSLPGLRRSNSFGDLSQRGIKSRISWRQSNGNLSRSTSFGNLSGVGRGRGARGPRRRGGNGLMRRVRGGAVFGVLNRLGARPLRGRYTVRGARGAGGARGAAATRGAGGARGAAATRGAGGARGAGGTRGTGAARGAGRGARGGARGRGRGGITRQTPKPVPTKEELDLQLDQYMAGSKSALDRELDAYMQNAMEQE